jgi:hypothetical protein
LIDNDAGYDYSIPPDQHPAGCYEIELVIQRIQQPAWQLGARAQIDAPPATPSSSPLGSSCASTARLPTKDDGTVHRSVVDRTASRTLVLNASNTLRVGVSAVSGLGRIWRRFAASRRS